jgi:Domain of unknown function (DUF222)
VTIVAATTAPASVNEALGMLESAMGYLAKSDATAMAAEVQAQCLKTLEKVDSVETAARASILQAFASGQGCAEDADYSPRAWLVHKTRITRGAAAFHMKWARRAAGHPVVAAALTEPVVSESWARVICGLTDRLPPEDRDAADAILIEAVRGDATLADLLGLGETMYEMSKSGAPDDGDDPERMSEHRSVRLIRTFQGAGVLTGDLTPECAAAVGKVLDALSAPAGPEDTRTQEQRCHDALEEAMRRLMAADMVPARAGQPTKILAHIALLDLIELDADSALMTQWTTRVRERWAAARAIASENGGGDGGVWLEGEAAEAFACDAGITPVVEGEVQLSALEDLVRLCLELGGHGPGHCQPCGTQASESGHAGGKADGSGHAEGRTGDGPALPTDRGREALERAIIGKAVDLLSGPGGLASFLRRGLLGAKLGGPSLPLDVGMSENVPAGIRNAVLIRDQHCCWPGGCSQPASACHVHHVRHKARGGKTSVKDCVLLCPFHHLIAIHQWGWTLALNGDGTTTAWNKDRTKVLYSHGSPAARTG